MSKKLSVGDKVQCRLYNIPEKQFYGEFFTGVITGISKIINPEQELFVVKTDRLGLEICLHRNEIRRRI